MLEHCHTITGPVLVKGESEDQTVAPWLSVKLPGNISDPECLKHPLLSVIRISGVKGNLYLTAFPGSVHEVM
jgi:hypothetical protein